MSSQTVEIAIFLAKIAQKSIRYKLYLIIIRMKSFSILCLLSTGAALLFFSLFGYLFVCVLFLEEGGSKMGLPMHSACMKGYEFGEWMPWTCLQWSRPDWKDSTDAKQILHLQITKFIFATDFDSGDLEGRPRIL